MIQDNVTEPKVYDLAKRGNMGLFTSILHCYDDYVRSKSFRPTVLIVHPKVFRDLVEDHSNEYRYGCVDNISTPTVINLPYGKLQVFRTYDVPTPDTIYLV